MLTLKRQANRFWNILSWGNMENREECRYCGTLLIGKYPYAYNPKNKKDAKWNFYGGFVCCEDCDIKACLQQKSSMPGAGIAKSLSSSERSQVNRNWHGN